MVNPQVYKYDQTEFLARDLGKYILRIQNDVLLKKDKFRIAVSGGSLVQALQLALIEEHEVFSKTIWSKWEIYFSDERLVALDHAESNYKLFKDKIIDKLIEKQVLGPEVFTINESLIHESDSSNDSQIAQDYALRLPEDHTFDLILLGLGPDGHTASLFPNHVALKEDSKFITNVTDSPKPPPRRITFTLPLLAKSRHIAFVAEGYAKAPVIKKIFSNEKTNLPGELVNELPYVPVTWFVNNDAVAGVTLSESKFE